MGTKALTKKLIKDLGKELSETAFVRIAYGNAGIPKSTFYFWKAQAEEIDSANPERENLTRNEELLLEFLDTIDISRAKAGKTLIDAAFRHAKTDGNVAIKLIERLFPDDFAAPARREITIRQESFGESATGIALIPTMAPEIDLAQMLQQQQTDAFQLAKTKTNELSGNDHSKNQN